ncbi:hypothetical protein TRIUR3_21602 [Triticum urartu]|uniref:Uncharacterized protein n=1 Tax=Triticum urartu TaxID=4572 RepID=M7Z413_TRIUA|nr:hypothetical protein TRIUR3_21602 [Triticum urartu]
MAPCYLLRVRRSRPASIPSLSRSKKSRTSGVRCRVCVRRFVIPTGYLGHPVFRLLLEKAEEEFGFRHEGALAIPCDTEAFKYILQCVERHDKGLAADDVDVDEGNLRSVLEPASSVHHVS